MTERMTWELDIPGFDRSGTVIRYGHYGRPVVVLPSERGRAWDYENNGMVDAVRDLIDAGRVKLYCVDSVDDVTWSDQSASLEERARRHRGYEAWVVDRVVPLIDHDSPGHGDLAATGCSLGAYHALQLALTRADVFPLALCQSGSYDPSEWHAWGERGDSAFFTNPTDYVGHLHGDHLDWLRSRVNIVLVVGEGPWEVDPTGSLPGARRMAELLAAKQIPHQLDVWGHDSAHDWPWWQLQLAYHLPRFC